MSPQSAEAAGTGEKLILIGTHGFHIHSLIFNPAEKTLRPGKSFKTSENPSWLTAHPTIPDVIYANGHAEGKVFALRLLDKEGGLAVMSEASSGGNGPTHIAVHPQAGIVLVHYNTGNTTTVPLTPIGELAATSAASSFHPNLDPSTYTHHPRQEGPHAHHAVVHQRSGDVFVPDLGSNVVWRLRWDTGKGELVPVDGEHLTGFELGDGPRHLAFHPDGQHAYTITELSSNLVVHSLKSPSTPLSRHSIQTPPDLAASTSSTPHQMLASEVTLLPPDSNGQHLLITSNRDSADPAGDALALFSVNSKDGAKIQPQSEQFLLGAGKHLRGVDVDKSGQWVCVTGRNGGGVVVYERIGGGLKEVVRYQDIERPVCPLWV